MTELFEQRLSERLRAHPLPEEVSDLGLRSVRLGQRMRRRQDRCCGRSPDRADHHPDSRRPLAAGVEHQQPR